jgi:hypothetical protein
MKYRRLELLNRVPRRSSRALPMEYALEPNRLIALQTEGTVAQ